MAQGPWDEYRETKPSKAKPWEEYGGVTVSEPLASPRSEEPISLATRGAESSPPRIAPRVQDVFSPEQSWIREQAATKRPSFNSPVKDPSPVVQDRPGPEAVRPMAPTSIPPTVETTPVGRANAPVPGRIPGMERLGGAAPGVPPVQNPMQRPPLRRPMGEEYMGPTSDEYVIADDPTIPALVRGVSSAVVGTAGGISRAIGEADFSRNGPSKGNIGTARGFGQSPNVAPAPPPPLPPPVDSTQNPVQGAFRSIGQAAEQADDSVQATFARDASIKDFMSDPKGAMSDPRWWLDSTFSAVGSMAPMAAAGVGTSAVIGRLASSGILSPEVAAAAVEYGPAVAASLTESGQVYGSTYTEARKAGLDPETARMAASLVAAGTGLTAIPAHKVGIFNDQIRSLLKRAAVSGGAEGAQEGVQTWLENLVAKTFYDPQRPLLKGVPEAVVGAAITGTAMGSSGVNEQQPPQAAPPAAPTPTPAESTAPAPPQQAEVPAQVPPPPAGFTVDPLPGAIESAPAALDQLAQELKSKQQDGNSPNRLKSPEIASNPPANAPDAGIAGIAANNGVSGSDPANIPANPASSPRTTENAGNTGISNNFSNAPAAPDDAYRAVIDFAAAEGDISTGKLQKQFKMPFGDAVRMMQRLEADGQIEPPQGRGKQKFIGPQAAQPVPAPGPREEVVQPAPVDAAAPVAEVKSEQEPDAPLSPEVAAPPSAVEAAAPEAPERFDDDAPLYDKTPDELQSLHDELKANDKNIVVELFGEQGAKVYERASRSESDKARAVVEDMEDRLTEQQRNRLYGIGDKYGADEVGAYLKAFNELDFGNPASLGYSLQWALSRVGEKKDPQQMGQAERVAYATIRNAFERASDLGFDQQVVMDEALKNAAARFSDPEDARFMLRRFMREPGKPAQAQSQPPGELAAPEAQPPAAPKEPPAGVAASVKRYLETISDVNRQLAEARTVDDKFGGEGRYENEVWDRLMGEDGAVTAEANKKLQVFRELAVKNGVDAEAFIEKMGGMPESPALSERAKKYRGESVPPALESPGERSEAEAAVDRIVGDRTGSVTAVDDMIDAYFSDPRKAVLDEIKKRLTDLQYDQVAFDELNNEQRVAINFIMANKVTDDADLPTVKIRRAGDPFSTPTIPVEQRGEGYDDRKFAIKARIRKGEVPTNKDMAFLSDVDRAYMVRFGEAEGVVIPPRAGKAKKPAAVVEEPVAPPAPAEQPKDFQWNGPVPNFENFRGQSNPAPDAPPPADSRIVYGRRAPAKTARGYKVETKFAVVPMSSLRISNSDNGEVNPNYPGELQPRQRDRKSSDEQIQEIIAKFDPDQLAENYLATDGAPIIGEDLAVESGNGRSMALRRIYERFPQKAKLYQDWLVENADRFGLDPEDLAGIENPVLVRVRKTLPKGISRTDFGRDANERTTGGMSPAEQAAIDARGLDPEIMRLFKPSEDGKINTMANAPFVRAFFASIVPVNDRGPLRDGDGDINPAGIKRIENAIFAKAYGDRGMIEKMAEDPDDNIKSVVGAMLSAANRFISMRNAIENGDLHSRDIAADLTAAAKILSNQRFEGKSIDDYLNQVDMFGRPKVQDAILATLRDLGRSKAKFLDILNRYVDTVEAAGNPKQEGMFGPAEPPPPPLAIWSSIVERAQENGQASQDAAPQGGLDASRPESGDGSGKSPAKKSRRAESEQGQPGRPADSGRAGNTVERTKDGLQETLVTDLEARESQIAAKNDSNRPLVDMPFSLSAPEAPAPTGPDPRQDSMFGGEDSKADEKARIIGTRIEDWNANKYGIQSRYPLITSNEQWAKFVNDYADAYIKDDRAGSIIDYYNSKVAGIKRGGWNDSEVVGYAPKGTLGAKPPSNGSRGKKANPPTGPRTGTAVSRSEIVKNLSSFLNNIPIRTGGFRERAAGIFKVRQNVIRTAKALDLETISHEIGHAIHKYLWGTRKGSLVALNLKPLRPFQNELGLLDYDQNKQRAYEGFAEYIRLRITKPSEAKQRAPRFHAWFNQKLSEAPELADVLKKAQEQYSNWDIQPSTVKLAKSIDTKPNHESFIKRVTDGMSDFRYNWIDDKTGLRDAVELFKRLGADVSDALNAYRLARTLSGTFTRANFAITNKTVGADNAPNGAGLGEILKPIADRDVSERNPAFQKLVDDWGINLADDGMDDFRVYIVARRLLDYRDKGLETGFTLQELKRAVADTVTPAVKEAAEELHEYSGRILDYAYEKGAMTEETREAIRSKNEFYVPLHRVMDNVGAEDAKAMLGRKMLDLNSPVLKRKGSTREIIDPLESVIKNTYAIMSFADRNAVAQALVKQAERVSDQGYLVESGIVNPMKATTFNLKEVGKDIMAALEEAGIDGSELELDHMSTIFRPNMDPRRSNGVVRVIVDGIPKLYQMDKNLIRALDNTDAQSADLFKRMAANAAASLRFGATAGNPEFILTNFFRDQFMAGIQSRNGYIPIVSGMWGAFKMLSDPKAFQEWQLAGGATAAMMPLTRKNLRLTVDKVTKSKKDLVLTHPAQIFPLLRDALTFFGEKSEASTRFAEYLLAKGKGKSTAEAVFDSRDVSLDFERMGKIAKTVNQFVPFFSVALNASERFVEMHNPRNKKQFAQSLAKGLLGITIPTMMLWLLNKDDEEYKNVEAWKRDLFWLIPTKYLGLREEFGPFIRIPKPPMWGQLYGSFFERLADSLYSHNKHAFDDFGKTAFQTLLPPASVQAIKPVEEVMSNYNAFTDRPIETEFMKKLSPENRYTPTTSELSKGISKVIGGSLSPVQVEHLLLGYTAGLGRVAITAGEELSGLRKDRPAMEASERPFIRAFATPSSPYLSTDFKLFKERLQKLKQKQADFKFSKDPKYRMTSAEETKLSKLEDINERVNEIRSKQFKVYGNKALSRDEKRRELDMMNKQRDEILKRTKPLYD